jgi:HlyD family secretion protein
VQDEHELMVLDNKIASAKRKVESLRERLARESVVVSPYAGRVVELKVNLGELVERGTSLFTLIPANTPISTEGNDLIGVIYVPAGEGKQIRPGMPVALSPSTAKREEFGFLMGRVRTIAEVPSTPEGKWSSSRGPDIKINGGTLGQADVEVASLPLLSLVIPPLRQFFGSQTP